MGYDSIDIKNIDTKSLSKKERDVILKLNTTSKDLNDLKYKVYREEIDGIKDDIEDIRKAFADMSTVVNVLWKERQAMLDAMEKREKEIKRLEKEKEKQEEKERRRLEKEYEKEMNKLSEEERKARTAAKIQASNEQKKYVLGAIETDEALLNIGYNKDVIKKVLNK